MLVDFFIPFVSLILGLILLIGGKYNKKFFLTYKSYNLKLNAKSFLFIFPVLIFITIVARAYCLHLTNSTLIFNITLLVIQLMIVFNFTLIANITSEDDVEDENSLISYF